MDGSQEKDASLPRVLLFGGTTEGRHIAEWLSARGSCQVVASSLTEFGASLIQELPNVTSLSGRMLPEDMRARMESGGFECVIDATHPYATGVSASIQESAEACGLQRYRVLREGEPEGPWESVGSAEEAAALIASRSGKVLLTTGSNDLPLYVRTVGDFKERLYARILPIASSVSAAADLGIPMNHVIAMKGPFSKELNCALIREFGIDLLVTKASGTSGGFWEKVDAAEECGIDLVVIRRPLAEEGLSMDELKRELETTHGL